MTVSFTGIVSLKNANETSLSSATTSPTLSGDWGIVSEVMQELNPLYYMTPIVILLIVALLGMLIYVKKQQKPVGNKVAAVDMQLQPDKQQVQADGQQWDKPPMTAMRTNLDPFANLPRVMPTDLTAQPAPPRRPPGAPAELP